MQHRDNRYPSCHGLSSFFVDQNPSADYEFVGLLLLMEQAFVSTSLQTVNGIFVMACFKFKVKAYLVTPSCSELNMKY